MRKKKIYEIPEGKKESFCKAIECDALIYWINTDSGAKMPVNPDGTSHWGTCKRAEQFKKKKE